MDQNSPTTVWYIIGAVVIIAALGFWYYSTQMSPSDTEILNDSATADISAELDQIPDDSGALEQDAAAAAIQAF